MSSQFVCISYRSLPKFIRQLIEKNKEEELKSEIRKAKYSSAVSQAALYYFGNRKQTKNQHKES